MSNNNQLEQLSNSDEDSSSSSLDDSAPDSEERAALLQRLLEERSALEERNSQLRQETHQRFVMQVQLVESSLHILASSMQARQLLFAAPNVHRIPAERFISFMNQTRPVHFRTTMLLLACARHFTELPVALSMSLVCGPSFLESEQIQHLIRWSPVTDFETCLSTYHSGASSCLFANTELHAYVRAFPAVSPDHLFDFLVEQQESSEDYRWEVADDSDDEERNSEKIDPERRNLNEAIEKHQLKGIRRARNVQKRFLPLLSRRFLLLMRLFYCSFDMSDPRRESDDSDDDNEPTREDYDGLRSDDDECLEKENPCDFVSPVWLADVSPQIIRKIKSITSLLFPKGDDPNYFRVETIRGEDCFVSDIAPLLIDLCPFEKVYLESIMNVEKVDENSADNNNDNRPWVNNEEVLEGTFKLSPIEDFFADNPRLIRRDNSGVVAVDTSYSKIVSSGFSGRTLGWCKKWKEEKHRVCGLDDEEQRRRLAERSDVLSRQHREEEERRRAQMNPSKSNLIRAFVKNLDQKQQNVNSKNSNNQVEENKPAKNNDNMMMMVTMANAVDQNADIAPETNNSNYEKDADHDEIAAKHLKSPVSRLSYELICNVFQHLLPSELHSAAISCRSWQRVVLQRIPLRRTCQLAQTFTRRVNFFITQEWGEVMTKIPFFSPLLQYRARVQRQAQQQQRQGEGGEQQQRESGARREREE